MFVKSSIREAEETLIIAAILVVIIIFVFLRNLRATIIPGLAIPTSIVATFAIMYFLGFSINNFTLLALTLAIGIVVDDAIIVLENAYRHQEELGEDPQTAAINGTREIAFAVIATTISLVAVFTPLAFLKGSTGRLFNEFGIAVAGSVIISGFVALTLTPMLCAKILRVPQRHGRLYRALEGGFNRLASGYARTLALALRHRGIVVAGALVLTVAAVFVFRSLEREFVPPEDRGWFFSFIIAPEGSSLAYTDEYQRRAEAIQVEDAGDRELLQRGEHRRRGEPRHHLHQPEGLVGAGAVGRRDHRRHTGAVLRDSRGVRLRHQSAGVRLGQSGELRHPASRLRHPGAGQRHAAGPRARRCRACSTWTATFGSTSRSSPSASTGTGRRISAFRWATSPPRSRCCSAAAR